MRLYLSITKLAIAQTATSSSWKQRHNIAHGETSSPNVSFDFQLKTVVESLEAPASEGSNISEAKSVAASEVAAMLLQLSNIQYFGTSEQQ